MFQSADFSNQREVRRCSLRADGGKICPLVQDHVLEMAMRTDIDEIVSKVERDGVCVVDDFIPADLLSQIRTRVDELNQSERRDEIAFLESGGVNQRVFNLVNKGQIFEEIVQHPDVMAAMGKLLGDFSLSGFSSKTPSRRA